jgi:hypothetical protein
MISRFWDRMTKSKTYPSRSRRKVRHTTALPYLDMQAFLTSACVTVESLPPDEFQAGQLELARDLIVKEQQIEYLISSLPGLDNSERDQEQSVKDLEEELKVAETQRLEAVKEKDEVLAKLDQTFRRIRRPH